MSLSKTKNLFVLMVTVLWLLLQFQFLEGSDHVAPFRLMTEEPVEFSAIKNLNRVDESPGDNRKAYIVYMGNGDKKHDPTVTLCKKMLKDVIGSNKLISKYLLHTYEKSFHGCVVMITDKEAKIMASMKGVVSVFPNRQLKPHTTRSWDFLGMPLDIKRNVELESDIIIGVIDTGIWPNSNSFSDSGLSPVPAKWKGKCDNSMNFTCNRKLIGARFFRTTKDIPNGDEASPRDTIGHGTHTASTAAGSSVHAASYFGLGSGTARGGVPSARIAVYKACWLDDCPSHDVLSAFDATIDDGVDILSVSLGGGEKIDYFTNSIAIGTFHAMQKGIFTSVSAGNGGPQPYTILNVAPWCLSVAASTIDRSFMTGVQLGDGHTFEGISINPDNLRHQTLIYGGDAQKNSSRPKEDSSYCLEDSLDPKRVRGKIVLCAARLGESGAFQAGASGIIVTGNVSSRNVPFGFPLPTSYIDEKDGNSTYKYIKSKKRPTGSIYRSVEVNDTTAPVVALLSSRGPNPLSPGILKPDLTAPGVAILAAWSGVGSPTVEGDKRKVAYNIKSGTSMACPHATGVAAYVKSFHPDWSPSAIKSALMTTASPLSSSLNPLMEFAYGAGHINPMKALNPGLVYDASEKDYSSFLCGEGYPDLMIRIITGHKEFSCTNADPDLNYPSISLQTRSRSFNVTFKRVVTNVGSTTSTYTAKVTHPENLAIDIVPNILKFTAAGEKKKFKVMISGTIGTAGSFYTASLVWDDGTHLVRSPIVVLRSSS